MDKKAEGAAFETGDAEGGMNAPLDLLVVGFEEEQRRAEERRVAVLRDVF